MKKTTLRVLVVDDYQAWRGFVASTLQKRSDLCIIGEGTDGFEAVQIAQQLQPDLIVLDIGLPRLNGIAAARRIREVSPDSRILFVSENRSRDIAEETIRSGALGYVVKSDAATQLLPAVEAVLQGKQFVSASLTGPGLNDPENWDVEPVRQLKVESHEIKFHPDHAALVDDLAQFMEAALNTGSAVIVVGTEPVRNGLLQRLRTDGLDLRATAERKRYLSLNISDRLATSAVDEAVKAATHEGLHVAVG